MHFSRNADSLIFGICDDTVFSWSCGINSENKQEVISIKLIWTHFDYKMGQNELNFKSILHYNAVFVCLSVLATFTLSLTLAAFHTFTKITEMYTSWIVVLPLELQELSMVLDLDLAAVFSATAHIYKLFFFGNNWKTDLNVYCNVFFP